MPDALQPPKTLVFLKRFKYQRSYILSTLIPSESGFFVPEASVRALSLSGMPKPQKVQQVGGLHQAIVVQIWTGCMSTSSIVDVRQGIEIHS